MDATSFEELLQLVEPLITHQENHMKSNIRPTERLAVTLRYLACFGVAHSSGDLMRINFTIANYNFNNLCSVKLTVWLLRKGDLFLWREEDAIYY